MTTTPVVVEGVCFTKRNCNGDFKWMLKQPEYADAVFIITENLIDMLFSSENGGGTAALRKNTWPTSSSPRAVGIPTGWSQDSGGFRALDNTVKKIISCAKMRILSHLYEYPNVKKIIYSAEPSNTQLIGSGIFKETLDDDVIQHISDAIHDIPRLYTSVKDKEQLKTENIRNQEYKISIPAFQFALVIQQRDQIHNKYLALQQKINSSKRTNEIAEKQTKLKFARVSK